MGAGLCWGWVQGGPAEEEESLLPVACIQQVPCVPNPDSPPCPPSSQHREFDAVHRVRQVEKSLVRFLLRPELLAPIGQYYENPVRAAVVWLCLKTAVRLRLKTDCV